jgi:HTH-type transcriptional repressor of NAD biosynthesis genes
MLACASIVPMTTGLVIGKFYPAHRGHKLLIDTAMSQVDNVYIIVCFRDGEVPGGQLREKWIKDWYLNSDRIHIMLMEDKYDGNDSQLWAKLCKGWLGFVPDCVFTSEDYGERFSKYLGSKHVLVDIDRVHVPVSGTKIRGDPIKYLDYLEPNVRSYYVPRVVIVGAESTGKTTLAKRLHEQYKGISTWVPEYGRIVCEAKLDLSENRGGVKKAEKIAPTFEWTTGEFIDIALGQKRMEMESVANEGEGIKFIICDTDVFATTIWHERYIGSTSKEVNDIANEYEKWVNTRLYFLTDNSVPFVQDGYRDGEQIRDWMYRRFQEELKNENKKFYLLTGSYDDRYEQARRFIDELLKV